MTQWVIGKTGQLARAMIKARPDLIAFNREQLDLSDAPAEISNRLSRFSDELGKPASICLSAAYTDVDGAETEPDLALAINAEAPRAIAKWCARESVALIYISTDYVFDGRKREPYRPEDPPAPLNIYGQSKQAGEQAVIQSGCQGAILRTAWLYDTVGKNFLTSMIAQGQAGTRLRVVEDQIGRPTYAGDLADAVLSAMDAGPKPCKIYHVTNSGEPVSWAGFARAILPAADITGVTSDTFKRAAARPAYSVLDVSSFEADFMVSLPDWHEGLDCALRDLTSDKLDET